MSSPTRDVEDGRQTLPPEKDVHVVNGDEKATTQMLKLDKHGLPLVPQPSDHKDDPLVSKSSKFDTVYPTLCILPRGLQAFLTLISELVSCVEISGDAPDLLSRNGRTDGLGCHKSCFCPLGASFRDHARPGVLRAYSIREWNSFSLLRPWLAKAANNVKRKAERHHNRSFSEV